MREVLAAFERAVGHLLPSMVAPRRPGDADVSCADVSKAAKDLDWAAQKSVDEMCADHWRWQPQNPRG